MEVLLGVSADYCGCALEHIYMRCAWPLRLPALGFAGMVLTEVPITLWPGAQWLLCGSRR